MNKDSLRSVCQSLGFETGGLEEFFRVATDEWKAHVVTGEWIAAMLDIARLKDTTPTTTTNNNNNNNNHFKFAEYDHLWCGFTALSEIRRKQIKEAKSSLHKKRTQEAAASKAAEAATASGGWLSAFTKEDPDAFGKVKKRKLSSLPENSQKFLKKVISPTSELLHNTNMYPGEKRNKVCKGGPDVDLHHQTDDKGGEFVFDDFGDEDGDLDNNEGQPEAHQVDDGNMLVESWEVSERSEQALMKTSMRAASEASSLAKRASATSVSVAGSLRLQLATSVGVAGSLLSQLASLASLNREIATELTHSIRSAQCTSCGKSNDHPTCELCGRERPETQDDENLNLLDAQEILRKCPFLVAAKPSGTSSQTSSQSLNTQRSLPVEPPPPPSPTASVSPPTRVFVEL